MVTGGVVVFLWWCLCGGVFVLVWWCSCGVFVVVVVFLRCFCVFVMVFLYVFLSRVDFRRITEKLCKEC